MAIADSRALLADIMNIVDEHVTAKASKELEKRILDVLDGYEIATMIRGGSGDADNSQQLIDAFINAKTAEGLAKRSIYLYRNSYSMPFFLMGVKERSEQIYLEIRITGLCGWQKSRRRNEHES